MRPLKSTQASLFDENLPAKETINTLDELFSNADAYRHSRAYFDLLKFISKFTQYSPFNGFLLYMQNPKVTFVATATKWKKRFYRGIKPGARPLVILAPMRPVLFVYDIEDTEGKPVPADILDPFSTRGDLAQLVWNCTTQNARQDGIGIVKDEDLSKLQAGAVFRLPEPSYFRFVDTGEKQIGPISFVVDINQDLPLPGRYASLVHEMGHVYCGHLGSLEHAWWKDRNGIEEINKEIEAESVSYLVCKRKGLETKSELYLAMVAEKGIELPSISLDTILKVVNYIELMGKNVNIKSERPTPNEISTK